MIEMAWELPVTFRPHVADWWMVGVTGAAALASLFVAIAALLSSRRANSISATAVTIAKDAADRDESYRTAEAERRDQEERAAVARAIFRLLAAFDSAREYMPRGKPSTPPETAAILNDRFVEAQAEVSLYATTLDDADMLKWLTQEYAFLAYLINSSKELYLRELATAREEVTVWNKGGSTGYMLFQNFGERHKFHPFDPDKDSH